MKVKAFTVERRDAILPREWLAAAEAERHHAQGDVLFLAYSKRDLNGMLTDRGMSQVAADNMTRHTRLAHGLSTPWQRLVDSGVIDPDDVGIYITYDHTHNSVIVKVDPYGTCLPVARLRAHRTRPMTVEPYQEDPSRPCDRDVNHPTDRGWSLPPRTPCRSPVSDRNAVIAEVLPDYRTTLQSIARSYCPNPYADADDLVQEGYIAMWRALETPREAENLAAYLTTTARHRIHDVARTGRTQFGTTAAPPPRLKARGEDTRRRITEFMRGWRHDHGGEPTDTVIANGLGLDRSTVSEQRKRMRDVGPLTTTGKVDVTWPTSLDALVEEADGWEGPLLAGPDLLDGVLWAYHHGEIVEAINALPPHHRVYVVDRFWRGMTEAESNAVRDTQVRWRRLRPVLAEKLAHLVDV